MTTNDLMGKVREMTTAAGKKNHDLISPYLNEFDSKTAKAMKLFSTQIPKSTRERIARLTPFELYCLLTCIDAEFPTEDKENGKKETRD